MNITTPTVITTDIKENIIITNSTLHLRGISTGTIHLHEKATLELFGIHNGDITVDSDCLLNIRGMLKGNIFNQGQTQIMGIIDSKIIDGHSIKICKDSVINGKRYLFDEML